MITQNINTNMILFLKTEINFVSDIHKQRRRRLFWDRQTWKREREGMGKQGKEKERGEIDRLQKDKQSIFKKANKTFVRVHK